VHDPKVIMGCSLRKWPGKSEDSQGELLVVVSFDYGMYCIPGLLSRHPSNECFRVDVSTSQATA